MFYRDASGAAFDGLTGQPMPNPPADAAMVRLNNRLRGVVQAAIGSLTLLSPEPERRRQAAAAVFRSRDASALPAVETALSRETVPGVRKVLEGAKAAIQISDPSASETARIAAAQAIAALGDQDGISLLKQVLATSPPPALTEVIQQGIAAIERAQRIREVGQTVWFGISLGSVLLLAAIGLAITFGVMGVINMAHGEMVMIGAYTTFLVQDVIRTHAPACSTGRCQSRFRWPSWWQAASALPSSAA